MNFNEYLQKVLDEDIELKCEYDSFQPEYEVTEKLIKSRLAPKLTQPEPLCKCSGEQKDIIHL